MRHRLGRPRFPLTSEASLAQLSLALAALGAAESSLGVHEIPTPVGSLATLDGTLHALATAALDTVTTGTPQAASRAACDDVEVLVEIFDAFDRSEPAWHEQPDIPSALAHWTTDMYAALFDALSEYRAGEWSPRTERGLFRVVRDAVEFSGWLARFEAP